MLFLLEPLESEKDTTLICQIKFCSPPDNQASSKISVLLNLLSPVLTHCLHSASFLFLRQKFARCETSCLVGVTLAYGNFATCLVFDDHMRLSGHFHGQVTLRID